jgi:hypothetical protein
VKRAGRAVELRPAPKARNAAHPQERQDSGAEGGTRDRVRPAGALDMRRSPPRQGTLPEWAETQPGCAGKWTISLERLRARTRLEPGPNGTPRPGLGEHRSNIARDFLGTFCSQPSLLLPKCPLLFPFSARCADANCYQTLEKSGAGDGNRTHDIQLGKLSFYH